MEELIEYINNKMSEIVGNCTEVRPEAMELDPRGGPVAYVDDEIGIIIKAKWKSKADYFWGFQYVDEEHVRILGNYVVYSKDDDRIEGHIKLLEEVDG